MAAGIPYDSPEGRAICGALSAIMTGVSYATSAEMAEELGAFPGYEPNAADMLRVVRNHRRAAYGHKDGYEKLAIAPVPLDHAACPSDELIAAATPRLGPRHRARAGARLPQRAGHRHRADRHHRPRHGLRHHRHRARLRAREVQEAGGRRLLQDHQPGGARGPAWLGLRRGRHRRDRGLCRGPRLAAPGAGHQSLHAQDRRASRDEALDKLEGAFEERLRHQVRLQPLDARRGLRQGHAQGAGREAGRSGLRPAHASGLLEGRHRGRQRARVRGHDAGRRAASEGRAPARFRLRQSVRPQGQALSVGGEPHPHDGGRRSPSSRAPSPRPSTCPTMPAWRTARSPTCCRGSWR